MPPSPKKKNDAVVEFQDPLDEKTLERYLGQYPGMRLEMLGVPEDYLWLKSTQLSSSDQPLPSGQDLFREYFTELAGRKGWNAFYYKEIWSSVLPWEQHFQWTNLSSDLREEQRRKFPIESNLYRPKVEIPISGDEAMLSKPRTGEELQGSRLQPAAAGPLVTGGKVVRLNNGSIQNRMAETSRAPESDEGSSSAPYVGLSALDWNRHLASAKIYASMLPPPPNYGTLEENVKFLLGDTYYT